MKKSNRDALKYSKELPSLVGCNCFLGSVKMFL